MKKVTLLVMALIFALILSSIAMAEDGARKPGITVKAGITATMEKTDLPVDTNGDGITDINVTVPGRTGFNIEGDYTLYTTEYVDINGMAGLTFYGEDLNPGGTNAVPNASARAIYYMGGVKIFPTKEVFYIGAHAGGVTYTYSDMTLNGTTFSTNSSTNFVLKVSAGAETKSGFVVEGAYLMTRVGASNIRVNSTTLGTFPAYNSHSLQIQAGYKF